MSMLNNRESLNHYLGRVWLTKPVFSTGVQSINVCVEKDGEFVAVDRLELDPNGIYLHRGKPLGRLKSDALRRYVEKLAGAQGGGEAQLWAEAGARYAAGESLEQVAAALRLSKTRVRRILITRGQLAGPLISQVAWLYDGGKGKTVAEIAGILGVSEDTVKKNLPYDKKP